MILGFCRGGTASLTYTIKGEMNDPFDLKNTLDMAGSYARKILFVPTVLLSKPISSIDISARVKYTEPPIKVR